MNRLMTCTVFLLALTLMVQEGVVDAQEIFARDRRNPAPTRDISAAEVRDSIKRGIQSLESRQRAGGVWNDVHHYSNGATALCTLALVNAYGRSDVPSIQNGLKAILKENSRSTYFVSLRVMCLAAADPKGEKYRRAIQDDIDWLVSIQEKSGESAGGWAYGMNGQSGTPDASNSQFAILALHEASQVGAVIDGEAWNRAKNFWKNCRKPNGSYKYKVRNTRITRSMAAAGMASTIIIDENIPDLSNLFDGFRIKCCGKTDDDFEKKTADFLGSQFNLRRGARDMWQFYFMYALERAGRLSGRRFLGSHDWYREGTDRLLSLQVDGGTWKGSATENADISTAMSLLFLSKGKRPVAIGKYLFANEDDKLHSKGVHYLTRNLEKAWDQKLNWQEVKGATATVDDLLESPIIFMSGNGGFVMSDFQKDALKQYLENGGFLFADACQGEGCKPAEFNRSFRGLMAELFPESPLEPLPENHPVWTSHYRLDRPDERPLLGLQACCKTSVIYCPRNLACLWNVDRPGVEKKMKEVAPRFDAILDQVKYATKVGVNVAAYATGRELKEKGDRPKLAGKAKSVLMHRSLELPKLIHNGGHDEAPNAWRNIQKRYQTESGSSVNFEKKFVNADLEQLGMYPFVFMHGRKEFSFSEEEREALRDYLQLGGFIFADAICSSKEFASSFRSEMEKILGEKLKPIPAGHALWRDRKLVVPIKSVTIRSKRGGDAGQFEEIKGPPELEGHEIDGRLVVVFSPNDISCAMESSTVSQCDGYRREDAERIGANVIYYRIGVQ